VISRSGRTRSSANRRAESSAARGQDDRLGLNRVATEILLRERRNGSSIGAPSPLLLHLPEPGRLSARRRVEGL
jgi:hypothetical protein